MKRIAWVIWGWLALLVTTQAASFDCTKASSKIEKMICGDEKLSKLDEELNLAYKNVLQDESQSEAVRQAQKKWIKERNGCSNSDCVILAYQKRISELASSPISTKNSSSSRKPLSCPQCGTWNVFQADVVMPSDPSNAVLWNEPIGETVYADDKLIEFPDCGSFTYKTTSSKLRDENGSKYHDLSMQLMKKADSKYLPQCNGENWTLNIEFDDNEIDDGGWGGAYFVLLNSGGKQLRLTSWNEKRRDLTRFGSNGEGQLASFQLDHAAKELASISNQVNTKYKAHISTPFDLDQFHDNAQEYCEKQYEDTPGNPSISARELECELNIYNAKYKEFESWKCKTNSPSGLNNALCKLPVESIDESKDYTNP